MPENDRGQHHKYAFSQVLNGTKKKITKAWIKCNWVHIIIHTHLFKNIWGIFIKITAVSVKSTAWVYSFFFNLQLLLQGGSWEGHIKFSFVFFFSGHVCFGWKKMLQKFKPCYAWTKRDVRLNLLRDVELRLGVGRGEACAAVV